ncbi:MAG: CBS domain-containing protein [Micromonosporaceae bacterium]
MTSPAITILPSASVIEAARLMEAHEIKRLPVVDDLGRLVGIVSRHDLVRIFLRPDTAIRDEVIEQVLRRTLWVLPGEVKVGVQGGVVTLSGLLERTSMIEIALRLTSTVDGVVGVINQLTAAYDDTLERTYQGMTHPPLRPDSRQPTGSAPGD